MKKLNFAFVCVVLALGANAEPTLTDVKAQTHYPWDGKVDLSYTTQGVRDEMIAKGLELSLRVLAIDETTHMTNTASPAALSGDMTFEDGTHAFVWDMDKQGLKEINSSSVVFKVTCMAADGDDYNTLQNKPQINDVPLVGNQAATALKIFAPTTGGTSGNLLVSGGANAAPSWKAGATQGSMLMSGGTSSAPTWENWTEPRRLYNYKANIYFKKCGTLYIVWGYDANIGNSEKGEVNCGNIGLPSGWICDVVRSSVVDVSRTTDSAGSCWVDSSGNIHVWGRQPMTMANFNLVFSIRKK